MIGLDTNVLVRFLTQDDKVQSALATRVIESLSHEEPGYVPLVVVTELAWVLTRAYKYTRDQIGDVLEGLLRSSELVIQHKETVLLALGVYRRTRADFGDVLIEQSARIAGCRETVTFDKSAAQYAGMRLLK